MGDPAEEDDGAPVGEAIGVSSFSQLLLSDDVVLTASDSNHRHDGCCNGDVAGEYGFGFGFRFSGDGKGGGGGPRMLCFGGGYQNDAELLFPQSPVSSSLCSNKNTHKINDRTVEKPTKSNKRTGSGNGQDPDCDRKPMKKSKRDEKKSSHGNAKVRKEKLGERITALQQLVSPYGKTDTASVLHEAMGYIKFLQDQVQVLCSPYLLPHPRDYGKMDDQMMMKEKDLRSRGLCLVPVSYTVHVANTNGADFWSPAMSHSLLASINQWKGQ